MRSYLIVFGVVLAGCTQKEAERKVPPASLVSETASSTVATSSDRPSKVDSGTASRSDTTPRRWPTEAELLAWRHLFAPDSFPALPTPVRGTLDARHCQVPSPWKTAQNVITGGFTAKGAIEWAVLCSVQDTSRVLILNVSGAVVDSMEKSADARWIQSDVGNAWIYSQLISVVALKVLSVVPADTTSEGGPIYYGTFFPRPIDHDGIAVNFLGKYAITYYSAKGKWYEAQTAD